MDLGKYVLMNFLQEWLILEEICLLDTGCCNFLLRPNFLNALTSGNFTLSQWDVKPTELLTWNQKIWIWASSKNFQCDVWLMSNVMVDQFEYLLHGDNYHMNIAKTIRIDRCWEETVNLIRHLCGQCSHSLTEVCLTHSNKITDEIVQIVATNCPNLLTCKFNKLYSLTDHSIIFLSQRCPSLMSVDISCIPMLTDSAVIELSRNCPNLTALNIGCVEAFGFRSRITYASILSIAEHCHQLTDFDTSFNTTITAEAVATLVEKCQLLTALNVSDCEKAYELVLIVAIATHCHRLVTLNVKSSFCSTGSKMNDTCIVSLCNGPALNNLTQLHYESSWVGLTATSLVTISNKFPLLREVHLDCFCDTLIDADIIRMSERLLLLETVVLGGKKLTGKSIQALARNCKQLTDLSIMDCPKIKEGEIISFTAMCPGLTAFKPNKQFGSYSLTRLVQNCRNLTSIKFYHMAGQFKVCTGCGVEF